MCLIFLGVAFIKNAITFTGSRIHNTFCNNDADFISERKISSNIPIRFDQRDVTFAKFETKLLADIYLKTCYITLEVFLSINCKYKHRCSTTKEMARI